jgi:hypothetical protein
VRAHPLQQVPVAADGGCELPVGQVPAHRIDHGRVMGQAVRVDSAGDLRAVVRHAGHVRPCVSVPRAARAGRAGGQDSDGASGPSSYKVTNARPAACVVTPGGPTNPKQDSRDVSQSASQTHPQRHHVTSSLSVARVIVPGAASRGVPPARWARHETDHVPERSPGAHDHRPGRCAGGRQGSPRAAAEPDISSS